MLYYYAHISKNNTNHNSKSQDNLEYGGINVPHIGWTQFAMQTLTENFDPEYYGFS